MQDTPLLERLAEVFQISPDTISPDTRLGADAWDSVAMLGTMAVLDELFGVVASADELKSCRTVGDLMRLAGGTSAG